ncbi:helix-turn-helix transcriptional regulator [Streptomyces sp. NPDC001928]|uniref:helix-turn-helix domain-containing protein n=1 Tax=Streptomyces sp. NPDC001928 TaxID=3154404 RepID=UPI00332C4663
MTATSYERVLDSLEAALAGLEETGRTASTAADEDALALRSAMADFADYIRRPIAILAAGRQLRLLSEQELSFPALAAGPDFMSSAHIIVGFSPCGVEVQALALRLQWREKDQSTVCLYDIPGVTAGAPTHHDTRVAGKSHDALSSTKKAAHTPLPHACDLRDSFLALKSAESFVASADYAQLITDLVEEARNIGPGNASLRAAALADHPAQTEGSTVSRGVDPSLNRRKLRNVLRQARQQAGMSQQDVARHTQWSPSKLIRIEGGTVSVSAADLRTLMALYGINEAEQMRDLEEAARNSKGPSWWSPYSEVISQGFAAYLQFEQEADSHRLYHPVLRPAACPVPDASVVVVPGVTFRWGTEFRTDWYEQDFSPGSDADGAHATKKGTAWWWPLLESVSVPPQAERLACAFTGRDTFPATEVTGLHSALAPWRGGLSGASFHPRIPAPPSLLVPSSQQPEAGGSDLRMPFVRAARSTSRRGGSTAGERTKKVHHAFGARAGTALRGSDSTYLTRHGGQAPPGVTNAGRWMPSRARHQAFRQWLRCVAEPNAAGSPQHRAAPPTVRSARVLADCRSEAQPRGHTLIRPGAGTERSLWR